MMASLPGSSNSTAMRTAWLRPWRNNLTCLCSGMGSLMLAYARSICQHARNNKMRSRPEVAPLIPHRVKRRPHRQLVGQFWHPENLRRHAEQMIVVVVHSIEVGGYLHTSGASCRENNYRRPGQVSAANVIRDTYTPMIMLREAGAPNPVHNSHRWLWVPAFAGTTGRAHSLLRPAVPGLNRRLAKKRPTRPHSH